MLLTELQHELAKLLAHSVQEVKAHSAVSHTDISDASAAFCLELFRELFELPNLRDLNAEKPNFPGIDLADDSSGRAFQITADPRRGKVLKTLRVSLDARVHVKYPHIQVYVTTEKQRSYRQESIDKVVKGQIQFNSKTDILDYTDILKRFKHVPLAKAEKILQIARAHLDVSAPHSMSPEAIQALERDLEVRLKFAIARAVFPEVRDRDELLPLAEEALSNAARFLRQQLRRDVLIRGARTAAQNKRIGDAEKFLVAAERLTGPGSTEGARALILEAQGQTDEALKLIRDRRDADSTSTFIGILSRTKGDDVAYEWIRTEGITAPPLTQHGLLALTKAFVATSHLDELRQQLGELPLARISAMPAVLFFRGVARLASAFPKVYQFVVLSSPPIHVGFVEPALTDAQLGGHLDEAIDDLAQSISLIRPLDLPSALSNAEWYLTWARLLHPGKRPGAIAKLALDVKVTAKAVQLIQLALYYLKGFDPSELLDHLRKREVTGGLDDEDLRALIAINIHQGAHAAIAGLIAKYRARYEGLLAPHQADILEIQALSQANDSTGARARLEEVRRALPDSVVTDLEAEVQQAEGVDPVTAYLRAYEQGRSLPSLRALVAELQHRRSYGQLGIFAEKLYAETQDPHDITLSARAYSQADDVGNFLRIVDAFPIAAERDLDVKQHLAWALMRLGRLLAAEKIANEFRQAGTRDLALEINLAIETGEWEKLASPLASYLENKDDHDAITLIGAAQTAFVSGHGLHRDLLKAAVSKPDPSAEVLVGAYALAVESGLEEQDPKPHEWFTKAVEQSGPDGPIHSIEMKELLDSQIEMGRHGRHVNDALMAGNLPIFLAAPQLQLTLVEAMLGNFVRNVAEPDARKRSLLPLFSGRRPPLRLPESKRIALDMTSLLVLGYLGLLPTTIKSFEHIVLSPNAMRELFAGQRGVLKYQRSRVQRALQLQRMLSSSKVKTVPPPGGSPSELTKAVGVDLSSLLNAARATSGIVVRPAPVMTLGSNARETADLSAYADYLCDTPSLLAVLKDLGVVNEKEEALATRYFAVQDIRWPHSARPTKASPLYLDDVTVSYLQTTELLGKVADSFDAVYVSESVADEANEVLNIDQQSAQVIEILRGVREAVSESFRAGNLTFAEPKLAVESAGGAADFPTVHLLSNLSNLDTLAIDDRALNKDTFLRPAESVVVRIATTLDILEELLARGIINGEEHRGYRHRLRTMGASLVDLQPDEVRLAAQRSSMSESSEFREITNTIALGRVRKMPRFPAEIPWFLTTSLALRGGLKDLWKREPDKKRAAILSHLIVAALPRGEDWVTLWDGAPPADWAKAVNRATYAGLAFAIEIDDPVTRAAYLDWVTRRVLNEIEITDPDMFAAIVEQLKSAISVAVEKKRD